MTDKQIIIDGCNVSECPYYCGHDICKNTCHYFSTPCEWVDVQNCTYKQFIQAEQTVVECHNYQTELEDKLEAKEQECERLKEYFETAKEASNCNLKALGEMTEWADKLDEENDQLKAENDKYSLFIEKLCDYAGLECDSEEQAMRTLSDLASQMNKARWIIDRYKQTLTEIKEIATIDKTSFNYAGSTISICDDILIKINEVMND